MQPSGSRSLAELGSEAETLEPGRVSGNHVFKHGLQGDADLRRGFPAREGVSTNQHDIADESSGPQTHTSECSFIMGDDV